jgi:peptidoglycan/LPS O-acetylase OafA/YrhL
LILRNIRYLDAMTISIKSAPLLLLRQPAAGKCPALTGIRGIAACWVVGFHAATNLSGALGGFPARDTIVLRSGFLAVDLFFMLSGFVLALGYSPRFSQDRASALRDFVIGRLFRILPLNSTMLLLLLLLSSALPGPVWSNEPLTVTGFLAAMALVQAWGLLSLTTGVSATSWNFPAWSLSAEWAAYVLFPIVLAAGGAVNRASMAFAAAIAALLVLGILMTTVGGGTLEHSWMLGLPRCFLQFFAGACLWRAFDLGLFRRVSADAILLCGLFTIAIVVLVAPAELLAPFGFGALILACAMGSPIAAQLFATRTALFLGEISFSIYLSHAIILSGSALVAGSLSLADMSIFTRMIFLALTGLLIIGASALSWRVVERPCQAAGRTCQRRIGRRTAAGRVAG